MKIEELKERKVKIDKAQKKLEEEKKLQKEKKNVFSMKSLKRNLNESQMVNM